MSCALWRDGCYFLAGDHQGIRIGLKDPSGGLFSSAYHTIRPDRIGSLPCLFVQVWGKLKDSCLCLLTCVNVNPASFVQLGPGGPKTPLAHIPPHDFLLRTSDE